MKKLISLILIILVAVILGGALWYVFFASEEVRERAGQYLPFGASPSESSRFDSGGENGFGGAPEDGGLLPGDFEGGGRLPVLYQLHKEPVAGIGVFARAGKTRARYVERGLGHIY
ncbi:MAG: hypothetical protein GWM98_08345, partial [Nitrospinaceae bacterium]|nr:hypothetical protein [Nitrospinaceae bacterium]NIR54504.1 hypothetical protein [Nitrospinaceae bacterium]NIS84923.1 hypothetical protein [Nitrospinaceae bacterium]NIT81737.1 hypothetical protein [Nitrospinaceae bacterium]NIU44006.1 hypothetical protein [Nitrospinaceae bacterium]